MLGLSGLLAFAVLMLPAARKMAFPYTVLLAAIGVFLGLAEQTLTGSQTLGPLGDFLHALKSFEITADIVFFIFLPALVFEAALAIDVRRLFDDIAPILLLAIVGLLLSALAVGFSLHWVSGMGLIACLLLGAIVSATDPVAVVAIFKEVGAPKRLAILVEGESLFNDATAIVVFSILLTMLLGSSEAGLASGTFSFIQVFLGGVLVGYLGSRFLCWLIGLVKHLPLVIITLTISFAYLIFIVAEHYLHLSGVMAVVTAALVIGSRGRTVIAPDDWHTLHNTWEQIGFWANSIIFILVGMAVPKIMQTMGPQEVIWLCMLIVVALVARTIIVFGLIPIMNRMGIGSSVSVGYKTVMVWGGLRGAVSLALALAVLENNQVSSDVKSFIGLLVTGFVLFTLFFNATTIRFVIRWFGLDKLSNADLAIRDRAVSYSLNQISKSIESTSKSDHVRKEIVDRVAQQYRDRSQELEKICEELTGISEESWTEIGITILTSRERNYYFEQFSEGFLSSETLRLVVNQVEDLADAIKVGGLAAYEKTYTDALGFDWRFKLALFLQRNASINGPLQQRLAERFEMLLTQKAAIHNVVNVGLVKIMPFVDQIACDHLKTLVLKRQKDIETAANALSQQYPDYAATLESNYLEHGALRLEASNYQRLLRDSLISINVYQHLESDLKEKTHKLEKKPPLDLGLEPIRLVKQVPLFKSFDENQMARVANLLRPRLAVPGEKIITQGEGGDAMYFVSNGSLDVSFEEEHFMLGSGDFVGELALITHKPRNADVVSVGFSELLALYTEDFKLLLQNYPEMNREINQVAKSRLNQS